ncbi:hypothetical protein E4U41_006882 [Claviceps citrina]|nr:hypothetical protein E4U41_006882 [Claviceps citrina]
MFNPLAAVLDVVLPPLKRAIFRILIFWPGPNDVMSVKEGFNRQGVDTKALRYEKPEEWSTVKISLPQLRDKDFLVQVKACEVFEFKNLSWVDTTLLEPASCACHESSTGSYSSSTQMPPQMLAQLLRQNGGCQVTVLAPKGLNMDLAKSLDAADTLSNPVKILEGAINFVRRGGTLVVYGYVFPIFCSEIRDIQCQAPTNFRNRVYASPARAAWPVSKIFGDEITINGSFSETNMFRIRYNQLPRRRKVRKKGIVVKTFEPFELEEFGEALQSIKDKSADKSAINKGCHCVRPDGPGGHLGVAKMKEDWIFGDETAALHNILPDYLA